MTSRCHLLQGPAGTVEVWDDGDGPAILLLPSMGRAQSDFDVIVPGLVAGGLRVLRPEPRGIGRSVGPMDALTLHDLAADVAQVIREASGGPVVVAGHAFGNFVARTLAADHPELVRGVALVAASPGKSPPGVEVYDPGILDAIVGSSDLDLPEQERLVHLRTAFFAPGNDPSSWLGGWHRDVKLAQQQAIFRTAVDDWFAAGAAPILDLQAKQDTVAPRRLAGFLRATVGPRVTVAVIDGAGHALVPEQPVRVVAELIAWTKKLAT